MTILLWCYMCYEHHTPGCFCSDCYEYKQHFIFNKQKNTPYYGKLHNSEKLKMFLLNPESPTKNYNVLLYYNKIYKPIKSLGTIRLPNHNAFSTMFHERNDIQ